ncbi:MAG: hypothetical protein AAB706_04270 [Patescibacteria group bacterium]
MSDVIALIGLLIVVGGSIFTWVVRVERKLASICSDLFFIKSHILKWNRRSPVDAE